MHANHCPRNHFGFGLPYFILIGMEIRSKRGLLFYWHITLLGIMSSSHFIVAPVSPVHLERDTAFPMQKTVIMVHEMKTKWMFGTAAITAAKVATPSADVLECRSKTHKTQMIGHYAIKMLLLCAITVRIHAEVRAGCLDCMCLLKRDIKMKTDSYQSS